MQKLCRSARKRDEERHQRDSNSRAWTGEEERFFWDTHTAEGVDEASRQWEWLIRGEGGLSRFARVARVRQECVGTSRRKASERASERARRWVARSARVATTGSFVDHAHVSSSHATLLHAHRTAMRIRCDVRGSGGGGGGGADDCRANEIRMKDRLPRASTLTAKVRERENIA